MLRSTWSFFLLTLLTVILLTQATPAWSQADTRLKLSTEEQNWLDEHPVIRLGIDPEYQPIEMIIEGKHSGLSKEYIDLIAQKLGITFELQITSSWPDTIEQIKSKKIDVVTALHKTSARQEFLNFTDSYSNIDAGIITSTHNTLQLKLEDLKHKKVAIVDSYYFHDIIKAKHPEIQVVLVPNLSTGLQEVAFGTADALLATIATSTYYLQKNGISNLRIAGKLPYPTEYRLGIRKDWNMLAPIFNKALASISTKQQAAIKGRWIQLAPPPQKIHIATRALLISLIFTVFLLLLISIFWGYKLRKQVKQHTNNFNKELKQHRLTQQELKQAKVELEIRVAERTEALNETVEALFRSQAELEAANHQLSDMANNDGLTQIANRRHLDLALTLALGSTQENHLPLTFILGDIDFFKDFNDHYGHPAGDRCLHQIAQCLNLHARRNGELAARYGGEEFALLLPGINNQEAMQIAEDILTDINALKIPHEHSKANDYVSMSLGVVSIVPSEEVKASDLIHWADEALYAAKKSGRNCLRFASPAFPIKRNS